QMLLQSIDQGEHWSELSSDLTTNDSIKIAGKGHMMYCTLTTISESPKKAGLIWVGTDDGRIQMTPDFGRNWFEFTEVLDGQGIPSNYWTTRVFASSHADSTAFVCKSGFKFDDFRPFVARTDDMGKTWKNISPGLPTVSVNVIVEDAVNPNLLYIGTDKGIYFSLDGGDSWQLMRGNMPAVPVRDLVIHPREQDLVAGTYGRGLYIANIHWLQQITPEVMESEAFLFDIRPKPVSNISEAASWGNLRLMGDNHLFTPNEENSLYFYYWLKKPFREPPSFYIYDETNQPLDTLTGSNNAGINELRWHTEEQNPGTYRVVLKSGKLELFKFAGIKPAYNYPLLNWKRE
ncbi:MAG: hypothetical protein P8100_10985, partial [bacterium]